MTTSNTERQLATEAKLSTEAYTRAIEEFHNNLFEGQEHKNAAYSLDAIKKIVPIVEEYLVGLVSEPNQHGNKFWWNELRPLIKLEENSNKRGTAGMIADMVALNMIATLSQEVPYTALAAKMADASFNLLRIKYKDRDTYDTQAKKFFIGTILMLKPGSRKGENEGCEVFKFTQLEDDTYIVSCADKWKERVEFAASQVKARAFSVHPMVVKPVPHYDLTSGKGGLLTIESPLLKYGTRINGKLHPALANFNADSHPLFFKMINAAQETPYKVNGKLLDVINEAYGRGKFFSKYPSNYKQIKKEMDKEAAQSIADLETVFEVVNAAAMRKEKKKAKAKGVEMVRKTADILEMAALYRNEEELFFNLYIDQRHRKYTYVHTGSLTYMGGELAKALLVLGNGSKFNDEGITSLFQTLGNCLDFGKHSITTKEAVARKWYEDNKADFHSGNWDVFFDAQDIFDEPINGLAVCMELVAYEQDPEYVSGYIAHRDARCSGTSIIGTLMKDIQAMTLTSVVDVVKNGEGKLPDAYMAVANKGKELNTDPYFEEHDKLLFARSTWKTPVMTRGSYGASRYTIHMGKKKKDEYFSKTGNQALFRMNNLDQTKANDFTELMMKTLDASLPSCSLYLDSIQKAASKFIDENKYFMLTAPTTGFPMVRRKNTKTKMFLESPGSFERIQLVIHTYTKNLDKQKLISAVAPDAIHQIDASLLYNVQSNVNFDIATVHDSIGSHPNNTIATVKAYANAVSELATNNVLASMFAQLGAEAPTVNTATAEDIEDIKNSLHILA